MRLFNELLGAEVEVPENPRRIVSLAEDITEVLFMLGAGDRVVGVSSYCNRPPEAASRTRVGTYFRVSYARLEELRPDVILTTSAAQRVVNMELYKRGYPVFPIQLPVSVAGIVENVRRVGLVINSQEEAGKLEAKLITKLNEVISNSIRDGVSVYVEIDLGSPITVGQASFVHDMLSLLGLHNIYSSDRRAYFEPDMDYVRRKDPDVIIYDPKPGERNAAPRFAKMVRDRGWEAVEAVRKNRVIITEGDVIAHYGPSLILETMPRLLADIRRMVF